MLLNASKDIGLAVNTGKTKYIKVGNHQGKIMVGSKSYEKVKSFKYFDSLLTNKNSIHEEIKCSLKKEIHIVIQSKHFHDSKNLKIKVYKTIILPVALYGYETWDLTIWLS